MFGVKDYVCCCHGCGAVHIVKSSFMSSPLSIGVYAPNGQQWSLPAHSCTECASPALRERFKDNMDEHPVRKAYLNGLTPESRDRLNREFAEKFDTLPLKG